MAYGSSQARGQIRASAAGLHHSHRQHQIGATSSSFWILNPLSVDGLNLHHRGDNVRSFTHWATDGNSLFNFLLLSFNRVITKAPKYSKVLSQKKVFLNSQKAQNMRLDAIWHMLNSKSSFLVCITHFHIITKRKNVSPINKVSYMLNIHF